MKETERTRQYINFQLLTEHESHINKGKASKEDVCSADSAQHAINLKLFQIHPINDDNNYGRWRFDSARLNQGRKSSYMNTLHMLSTLICINNLFEIRY